MESALVRENAEELEISVAEAQEAERDGVLYDCTYEYNAPPVKVVIYHVRADHEFRGMKG